MRSTKEVTTLPNDARTIKHPRKPVGHWGPLAFVFHVLGLNLHGVDGVHSAEMARIRSNAEPAVQVD